MAKKKTSITVRLTPKTVEMLSPLIAQGMTKREILNAALQQYLIEREIAETRQQIQRA